MNRTNARITLALLVASLLAVACEGAPSSGAPQTPPPAGQSVVVTVNPAAAALDACGKVTFAALVTGATSTAANWTVLEAGGGTVANGVYSAPQTPGTYHVVATSVADPTRSATATVAVGAEKVVSVAVDPASVTAVTGGTLAFGALVTTSCGTFASR